MAKNITVKIDLILHATEDSQKITEPLNDLFGIEDHEIEKHEVPGHFGNPILMLHVELKKKRADHFTKKEHLEIKIYKLNIKNFLSNIF